MGWLCDFATFTLLVEACGVPSAVANFGSSYVGVTFVWFVSLKAVFGRAGAARSRYLFAYWGFQFVSILAYSQLLHLVVGVLQATSLPWWVLANLPSAVKIIITPFNLVTNFLFMKRLASFMRRVSPIQS